ncbi:5'-methylthioadenosine/S-adenosylhomocysteine nucleosidase [Pengzhenrongella frigida]|uniref:adenosylhomocysteine nucleosidase n=1 Tax=Pengzhenrongella frigida TaxID=1259133 RepID=A0A4Q5N5L8_9MICO|nr:5'-methylthioadenosine/S-adenosylhomocysteine nucleosidase [Cellulomonas sp. HLT2-17]RYV51401.1 5'-methylthioadenosine/S-adenosylhomocysteine nucleosidase [Cellulomonas sp. HLT2-17]
MIEVDAVVLTAMREEMAPFEDRSDTLGRSSTLGQATIRLASFGQAHVLLVTSGIGLVNAAIATALAVTRSRPVRVISAGSAGGLHPTIQVGDIVAGSNYVYGGADARMFGYSLGQVPGMPPHYAGDADLLADAQAPAGSKLLRGPVISGDAFIDGTSVDAVRARFPDALATDMESAAIAHTCHLFGVPFLAVRAISDLCGPEAGSEFHLAVDDAAARSADVTLGLIARTARAAR